MNFTDILYGVRERVATIRLNRPHSLNALTIVMLGEVNDALDRAAADESVRVIVLAGE
jgi:enoyl-CoA hydratase/carnithine racemase